VCGICINFGFYKGTLNRRGFCFDYFLLATVAYAYRGARVLPISHGSLCSMGHRAPWVYIISQVLLSFLVGNFLTHRNDPCPPEISLNQKEISPQDPWASLFFLCFFFTLGWQTFTITLKVEDFLVSVAVLRNICAKQIKTILAILRFGRNFAICAWAIAALWSCASKVVMFVYLWKPENLGGKIPRNSMSIEVIGLKRNYK